MAKIVDTLRLTEHQLQQILNELDARDCGEGQSKRKNRRWSLGGTRIVLTTSDSATQSSHQIAVARNLSAGGAAVMTGGYVHPGTKCAICVRDREKAIQRVLGVVRRCSHVSGRVHEIGIEFDSSVKTSDFIDLRQEEYAFDVEHVEAAELTGHLLAVFEDPAEQRLIQHFFRKSRLTIEFACSGEEGLELVGRSVGVNLLLIDQDLPDMSALHCVERLRQIGFTNPVVVLASEMRSDTRPVLLAGGADEVLKKPVSQELMLRATAEFLGAARAKESLVADEDAAADRSDLPPDLICEFIDEMAAKCGAIAEGIEADKFEQVRLAVRQMRSSCANFGFRIIGELAAQALVQLDASMSVEESREELTKLVNAAQRVQRPGDRARSA